MDPDRRALLGMGGALMLGAVFQPAGVRAQGTSSARIGIIGSGHIGGTIGGLWIKKGHQVAFSSRHPDELKPMVAELGSLAGPAPSRKRSHLAMFFLSPSPMARCRRSAKIIPRR